MQIQAQVLIYESAGGKARFGCTRFRNRRRYGRNAAIIERNVQVEKTDFNRQHKEHFMSLNAFKALPN